MLGIDVKIKQYHEMMKFNDTIINIFSIMSKVVVVQ